MGISQEKINRITEIAKSYGVTRLILFGSAATNPTQAKDIDLACDGVSDWDFYKLGAKLEEELDTPLDLVSLTPPNRFTRLIEKQGIILL
ncbi:MAG: nucleotidyltransferase domain-containing protein [Anaerolineales bacterium]|nr:nucleotidyltransferase domain-containing protein [Anaerolineales bacterium]